MHVAHFHPPRVVAVTLIAAVLAIVITLAFAHRVSDVAAFSTASGRGVSGSHLLRTPARAAPSMLRHVGSTPMWLESPFSPLLGNRITFDPGARRPY